MSIVDKDPFGARIKEYEKATETYLTPSDYTVVRIDGHGFSKWTKGFEKPFDELLTKLMSETSRLLMDEFHAVSAYSQSDEITLIFQPSHEVGVQGVSGFIYAGRVQKIVSLMASFASMTFNELLREALIVELKRDMLNETISPRRELIKSKIGKAFFDARVFQVPTDTEAYNAFLWRTKDCERNSKNVFAQSILTHKQCMHKTSNELVEVCKEMGFNWNLLNDRYKFGVLWKKGTMEVDAVDFYTKNPIKVKRSYFLEISKQWNFNDTDVTYVLSKKV
jgi:tRNA(His) 5'-end guanylyltransferase